MTWRGISGRYVSAHQHANVRWRILSLRKGHESLETLNVLATGFVVEHCVGVWEGGREGEREAQQESVRSVIEDRVRLDPSVVIFKREQLTMSDITSENLLST